MQLYRDIWDMLGLGTCGRLNFEKVECSVVIPLEDIHPYPDLLEGERPFKYSRYGSVR